MRIVQVVSPAATLFEQKLQRVDFDGLRSEHDVTCVTRPQFSARRVPFDLAHFYGERPHIELPRAHWWSRPKTVDASIFPEAVEQKYFVPRGDERQTAHRIGCVDRKTLKNAIAQFAIRLHRTREDIEIVTFDAPPSPEQLDAIGVWVDPAIDERDSDGYVAEALVRGLPVVASRTPINVQRLEKGRTGFLVPPNDPNEITHAILSALFKPEVVQQKIEAARQTMTKFHPAQRLRVLSKLYQSLLQ